MKPHKVSQARAEFRLPDGTATSDSNTYVESWRVMVRPLLKALVKAGHDVELVAYDPDFQIQIDGHSTVLRVVIVKAFMLQREHIAVGLSRLAKQYRTDGWDAIADEMDRAANQVLEGKLL